MVGWIYKDREITQEDLEGYVGFVYLIENIVDGRKYIGKKILKFSRKKKIKGRFRRVVVDSDYKTYYGSCAELKAEVTRLGEYSFRRIILRFCKSKSDMTYWEGWEQMTRHVLLDHTYYNTWVSMKVRRSPALGNKESK